MLLFLSSLGSKELSVSDYVVQYERTSCNPWPVSERTCAGWFGVHPQSVHNIVHMVLMFRAFNVKIYILCLYAISFSLSHCLENMRRLSMWRGLLCTDYPSVSFVRPRTNKRCRRALEVLVGDMVLEAGGGKWSIADSWPSPDITFAEVIILSLLLAFPTLFLTRRPLYTCGNVHADWLVQAPLFPSRKVRSLGRSEDPPKRRPPPFLVSTCYALFRCHDTDAKFRPAVLNLLG